MNCRLFLSFLLLLPISLSAQVQQFFNDGAQVYVQNGGLIHVQGGLTNEDQGVNTGQIFNSGDIELTGNWINNSTSNVFQANDPGTTHFIGGGALQTIGGSNDTYFNNLTLNRPGVTIEVRMLRDALCDQVLNLTNDFLNTQSFVFGVANPATNSIIRTGPIVPNYSNLITQGFVTSTPGSAGRLARTTNPGGTYFFPLGTVASGFRPVEITPSGIGQNVYSAQFVDLATPNPTLKDPTIISVHTNWYHFLNRGLPVGSPENIRVYYDNVADGVCDPSTLTLGEWDGSLWRDLAPVTNVGNASPILSHTTKIAYPGTYTTPWNTERFVLGDAIYGTPWGNCAILPVDLVSLTATPITESIQLDWATSSEQENAGFELERAAPGTSFSFIHFAEGKGSSQTAAQYQYEDEEVEFGIPYTYRLKQIDMNGQFSYSDEVSAMLSPEGVVWMGSFYPNPVKNSVKLDLNLPEAAQLHVSFINSLGQVIHQTEQAGTAGKSTLQFELGDLSAGAYQVLVKVDGKIFDKKLIVE